MKREYWEGCGYYFSCMTLFNLVFASGLAVIGGVFERQCGKFDVGKIIVFCCILLLFLIGAAITVCLFSIDYSCENTASAGKEIIIKSVDDQTGESYFSNFSLLVLTAIALPYSYFWYSIAIAIIIEIALGIIYVKQEMFYMNPFLSLAGFKCYRCNVFEMSNRIVELEETETSNVYYIIAKKKIIRAGDKIKYKNISGHILRFNGRG